jgi:heptosyltransferase-3
MLVKATKELPKSIARILLIQLGDLGDVVLTMPVIRVLRQHYPGCRLAVAVREKARDLLTDCPWLDDTVSIRPVEQGFVEKVRYQVKFFRALRASCFDLAIDLRTGSRGAILAYLSGAPYRLGRFADDGHLWRNRLFTHLVRPPAEKELGQHAAEHGLNILSPLHVGVKDPVPRLTVSESSREKALRIIHETGVPDRPMIAIHPFSLWAYKEWGANRWSRLMGVLAERGRFAIVLTGSPEERSRAQKIAAACRAPVFNLAGKTPLRVLPALFQRCRLVIGVDTVALHLAAAVGTPTIGLFGPSSPVTWAPRGEEHAVVAKTYPCVPCRKKGCEDSEVSRCLEELSLEETRDRVLEHMAFLGL